MTIQINEDLKLGADARQWILYQRYGRHWKPMMFFSRIESLLLSLMEIELRESNARDIEELIHELKTFRKWVNESHFIENCQNIQAGDLSRGS